MLTDYQHLIDLPKNYNTQTDQKFPLLIFLHGAGERGTDLEKLRIHGPPMQVAQGKEFDAIVLSPLCPADVWWDTESLHQLIQKTLKTHRVDLSRIYLTGLSMGGYGSWHLSTAYPDLFAAVAPICGGMDDKKIDQICTIKSIPVWNFHGALDNVVPQEESDKVIRKLKACGGNYRYTVYPEANHNSWTETYDNPEFYKWLFSQQREK